MQYFEQTGAVLKGHFLLTSGMHSNTYMQCAKLFCDPVVSEKLCSELAAKLDGLNIGHVVSPAIGGIIMGYVMAKHLCAKNSFAERVEGKMQLRRGFSIKPGERVLVVEDVVTTGGSVLEVIELCRAAGADVVAAASIVDRSNGAVNLGVRFEKLLSVDVRSYSKDDCPLCKSGSLPEKPGSRGMK